MIFREFRDITDIAGPCVLFDIQFVTRSRQEITQFSDFTIEKCILICKY